MAFHNFTKILIPYDSSFTNDFQCWCSSPIDLSLAPGLSNSNGAIQKKDNYDYRDFFIVASNNDATAIHTGYIPLLFYLPAGDCLVSVYHLGR